MNSKLFGGILMMVGTTIGAGMLALPVATASLGFLGSIVLLIVCWAVMTLSAFLFLEVNLSLPPNTNLISMAGATLGNTGQAIAWISNLMMLYAILCAYISGGGDLFHYVLSQGGIHTSLAIAVILFTLLISTIVYRGVRSVDYVNRGLMFGKLGAYILLVILVLPFISSQKLASFHIQNMTNLTSITVTVVAFGGLMIIPTLRTYFGPDIKSLRKAIFFGTFIPLVCYITWDMVIMGVIPFAGPHGLSKILRSSTSNSDLVARLTSLVNSTTASLLAKFFTSICMVTSFLTISLSLSDFLSDGFNIEKRGSGSVFIHAITFAPPLLIVLFFPNAFIHGLEYAGINCIILMILYPALMSYRGRYHCDFILDHQVQGGKILLAVLVIFATLLIGQGLLFRY